ncbi:hypothetical protein [Dongia sp.]|uniref:hypothetical protein n=1 Tax=Dongia sp. TaxID=1977262 RepID=UPI003753AD81
MIADPARRRLRAEAYADWLGLAYRGLFFVLISAPIWATVLALVSLWERVR